MFDEGHRLGRVRARRATKRNVNFPTLKQEAKSKPAPPAASQSVDHRRGLSIARPQTKRRRGSEQDPRRFHFPTHALRFGCYLPCYFLELEKHKQEEGEHSRWNQINYGQYDPERGGKLARP